MTPAQVTHGAFLLRQIASIDEWIDTLDGRKEPKVMLEIETTTDDEDTNQGYGDADTYIDRELFIAALRYLRGITIDRLKLLGIEAP